MDQYQESGTISAGEASPVDPLTEQEMTAISPDRLEMLGASLATRRDQWVDARKASGVEKHWLEDLDQYNGVDEATKNTSSMMDSVEAGFPIINKTTKPQRSTVFVNITGPKTRTAEARLANMLCPTDDRNWGIKPTPNPELTRQALAEARQAMQMAAQPQGAAQAPQAAPQPMPAQQQGSLGAPVMQPGQGMPFAHDPQAQPPMQVSPDVQQKQSAASIQEEAAQRAKAMENAIDEKLIACDYNGQQRAVLHDVAVLGTGIMKGPIVVNRMYKAWTPQKDAMGGPDVYVLEIKQDVEPASERVDPWNVFPDPQCEEDPHNGIGIYEKKNYTAKQLRELSKQPGYIKANIAKVLEEGPQTDVSVTQRDTNIKTRSGQVYKEKDKHFEVWEYWGEFSPEDLRSAGVDVPDSATEMISGCVVLVNEQVIKGFLNPIETGDMPYDFMVWEKVDGQCWGAGVPRLCRTAQKVLNAGWRQVMDNAGLSVGPQFVIDTTAVAPADGRWEVTSRKIWQKVDPTAKMADIFATFEIESHIDELQKIIIMAKEFLDEETSIPQIMQGEKGTAPDTVGGMTILENSSNVVIGRTVKQFDDMITRPHIRRYYDWMMAYSDDPLIKGEFQVDARGSSTLLVRDMAQQTMLGLMQYQGSGIISPMVNWEEVFKELLKIGHVNPADIMKSDAEIDALKNQPPQATPDQIRAQSLLQVAEVRAQAAHDVAKAKVDGELAYAEKMRVIEEQNNRDNAQQRQDELQLEILRFAQEEKMTIQDVQSGLAKTAMQERTKRQLAAAEVALRESESHQSRNHEVALHNSRASLDAEQAMHQRTHEAHQSSNQPAELPE